MNVEQSVSFFYSSLNNIIDKHVPCKVVNDKNKNPPWYTASLKKVLAEKAKYLRKYKIYGNLSDLQTFELLSNRAILLETRCYNDYMNRIENSIPTNPKSFWTYVGSKGKSQSIPSVMTYGDIKATNGDEICSSFANYFQSQFLSPQTAPAVAVDGRDTNSTSTSSGTPLSGDTSSASQCNIGTVKISEQQVLKMLKSLDINKSAGPDNIPPILITKCAGSLSLPLTLLFQKSIDESCVPGIWKSAFITPVHKKGAKSVVENYRPISKLCIFAKVFEKIVYDATYSAIAPSFSEEQHGFLRGRSTISNLVLFNEYVSAAMEGGGQVDCIYTDYSKAFDRIDHSILLDKIYSAGIHGDLFRWFSSYITNRSQAVVTKGYTSQWLPIPSGVPQGSLLGPLLFVIFINDIKFYLKNSKIFLFADDMKIAHQIRCPTDAKSLSSDLTSLVNYCALNKLDLNVSKCFVMTFSRKPSAILFKYAIDNHILKRVHNTKDLGVIHDDKLLFDKHIESIISRANRALGFVIRSSYNFQRAKTIKLLYCAFVRSILEYGSQVWNPKYSCYVDRIERIQARFLRYLQFKFSTYDKVYLDRCKRHHLLPLEMRRELADAVYYLKILNGSVDCPELVSSISFPVPSFSQRQPKSFFIAPFQTNYRQNSYLLRAPRTLNTLAVKHDFDVFNISVNSFKKIYNDGFFGSRI
ncbi:hypothetical protein ABMA27_010506 [Loxostege sticticalis]|uniref:Reverse transcriptase domain-containing protein n=1 Tax=Loxostege sticticalis TaxID=481309 RepID=A0ABR3H5V6_LOXSC